MLANVGEVGEGVAEPERPDAEEHSRDLAPSCF